MAEEGGFREAQQDKESSHRRPAVKDGIRGEAWHRNKQGKKLYGWGGLPEPEYEFNGSFLVTLHDRSFLKEKVGEKVGERLTKNQSMILRHISENPRISIVELSRKIGIAAKNIEANISKLKQNGLLKRIGPARGGWWKVTEEGEK